MLLRATAAVMRLINLSPREHRTIQSCVVVVCCIGIIGYVLVVHGDDTPVSIASRAMDWSFLVLMGTIGVYHATSAWGQRPDG